MAKKDQIDWDKFILGVLDGDIRKGYKMAKKAAKKKTKKKKK